MEPRQMTRRGRRPVGTASPDRRAKTYGQLARQWEVMGTSEPVNVAGAFEHPIREAPDRSEMQLSVESAAGALDDADLAKDAVDALFTAGVPENESEGPGEVYSHPAARAMSGWPEEDLPLVVAYVELDEGPRMITNIRADPDEVSVGTRVRVEFVDTEDSDVSIPVFVSMEE